MSAKPEFAVKTSGKTSGMHLNSSISPDQSSPALTATSSGQDTRTPRFSNGDAVSSAESSLPLAQSSPRGSLDASGLHLSQYPGSSFDEAASNLFPLEQDAPAPVDIAREYERQLSSVVNAVVDETNYLDCDNNTSRPPSGAQEGVSSGRTDVVEAGFAATDLSLEDFECSEKHVLSDGKTFKVAVVIKIKGMPVKNTKYTELRAFCGRVGIKAYKNKSKAELLELIAQKIKDDKLYKPIFDAKMAERRDPSRKQIQCPFRLLNIIFSDHFADRFASLADPRSRADLDAAISAETLFWEEVCGIFVDNTPSEVIDNLIAAHPALDPQRIDPAKIVPHPARQLRVIWRSSHAAYRKAHIRYTASGTNKDDFYSFCHGRLDALYVYLHLQKRPGLTATVNQELSGDVYYESENDPGLKSETPTKRKNDVAEAIRNFGNPPWREALALRKQAAEERKLLFLEMKEANKVKNLQQRSQIETRRAALQDYAFLSDRLRSLYNLQDSATNQWVRDDIEEEITLLKVKKQKLADVL